MGDRIDVAQVVGHEVLAEQIAQAVADAVQRAVPDLDRFVSIPEAAQRLGINADTARDWINAGTFPVPVRWVGGRRKVSLRRIAQFVNADTDAQAAELMGLAS